MSRLVSLCVCSRNRVRQLRAMLASAAALHLPEGVRAELIVVDNGSEDGTSAMVRAQRLPDIEVRVVHEPVRGAARARNRALAAARGDIILFADDDVRLPRDWIDGLCRPIATGNADAVAGTVTLAEHLQRPWMEPFHRAALAATELRDKDRPGDMFGASMAFSRDVLRRVPAFDEELGPGALGTAEDTLFSWQLLQAGFRIVVADVAVEHHPDADRLSRAAFAASARSLGRSFSYIRYHWRHDPVSAWTHRRSRRSPWWSLRLYSMKLRTLRRRRRDEWDAEEGMPGWEYSLLVRIEALQQYLLDRRRPRNYERLGLTPVAAGRGRPAGGSEAGGR
jgi:glycosyltransferase involved in cell wall biosynthesis